MKNINFLKAILFFCIIAFTVSCTEDFQEPAVTTGSTLAVVMDGNSELDIFYATLTKTNLLKSLNSNNSGSYTVFAPHDSAFLAYFRGALTQPAYQESDVITYINETLSTTSTITIAALAGRLNYHMVSSVVELSSISTNVFTTINGARLSLSKNGSLIFLNANIAPNGTYSSTGGSGAKVYLAGSLPSIEASNGKIHVINKVLTAVSVANSVAAAYGLGVNYATNPATITGGSETGGDATGTDFDIFAYALRITGVVKSILPNQAPLPDFTVFAPTDDAFRAYLGDVMPVSIVQENAAIQLLKGMNIDDLTNLVKYHVTTGRLLSTDLSNAQILATLNTGKSMVINKTSGGALNVIDNNAVSVNAAVNGNVNLTNAGVYYRIGAVLLPQ